MKAINLVCGAAVSALLASSAAPDRARTVVWASTSGAAQDSDLMTGGGTDDTAALQRILDGGAHGRPVHLMISGPTLVSGLELYSNSTIECTAGGGLYLKDDANRAILRNRHRSRETIVDRNITVRGCFLNGNRTRQRLALPPERGRYEPREPDGTFQSGLQFLGVQNLKLADVTLWNTRSFGIYIANANIISVNNVIVDTGLPAYPGTASLPEQRAYMKRAINDDAVHLSGPIQYATLDGLKLRTLDDALALNANDHWADDVTVDNQMGPYIGQGPITDVVIRNVMFMGAHQGVRLQSRDQRIDRVLIENLTGTVHQRVVNLSHFTNSNHNGDFGTIIFNNVLVDPVESPTYLDLYPEIRDYAAENPSVWDIGEEAERPLFNINSPVESLSLHHVVTKAIDGRPLIRVGRDAVIRALNIDLNIYDVAAHPVPLKLMGRVDRLNFKITWTGRNPIHYAGGSIGTLRLIGDETLCSDN